MSTLKKYILYALIGALIGTFLNILTYFIAVFTNNFSYVIPQIGQTLGLLPIILFTFIPGILAGVVMWILDTFSKKPKIWFIAVSVVAFIALSIPSFSLPGASVVYFIILQLLHIFAAVPVVWALLLALKKS